MDYPEAKRRILAAQKLLAENSTTKEKFEAIRELIKGINPRLDKALNRCSSAFTKIEKLKKGEVVELSLESLPQDSAERKKRKKALLLFLRSFRELKKEVERVKGELEAGKEGESASEQISRWGRIVAAAKGPFGIITLLAVAIAGFFMVSSLRRADITPGIETQPLRELSAPGISPTGILSPAETRAEAQAEEPLSYWVREATAQFDPSRNMVVWGVHVHKENAEIRKQGEDIPATGAEVTVELRSKVTRLTGRVGSDGWVRWETPAPEDETSLYIMDIQGELPWASANQNQWKDRPAASFRPELSPPVHTQPLMGR